ncbi:YegP family protein [Massilia violaceinigra]|uniref:YegP family protein n=1 Tax=Massilia violaceinigra TaxID=2045208 RepID=A0ABY4A7C3_9BURK|nr:YegP family protein [Massilia violaceinigra]UOD30552.1 YegP family protein [Massilia violaceinigra]
MYFEIYQTQSSEKARKEWRWRLKAKNNEIIASGESYSSRAKVLAAIELIKSVTARTKIVEE